MNISYKWLCRYIDTDLTPEEVSVALTSLGLEVGALERVETIRGGLRGLVVGHVLTCIDHPNSDHLHITPVDLGDGNDPVQIVCGAANVAAGQKVIVATLGTKLYDGDQEFTIKRSRMRGEESLGMICAEDEIGVGTSHAGIIVLPEDTPVGMPAADYYGIDDDWLIEVDLTPNRIDGGSHYGVARDLSAWCQQNGRKGLLKRPAVDGFAIDRHDGGIPVEVLCTEYGKIAQGPLARRGTTAHQQHRRHHQLHPSGHGTAHALLRPQQGEGKQGGGAHRGQRAQVRHARRR